MYTGYPNYLGANIEDVNQNNFYPKHFLVCVILKNCGFFSSTKDIFQILK